MGSGKKKSAISGINLYQTAKFFDKCKIINYNIKLDCHRVDKHKK